MRLANKTTLTTGGTSGTMRTIFARLALLPAVAALAVASVAYAATPCSTQVAIRTENTRWAKAFERGDYQSIGRLYTEDGTLLPPGGERVRGRAAIVDYFTKGYAGKTPDTVSFSDYEFYGNDQVVAEVASVTVRSRGGKLRSRGKQTLVFLKHGGAWKLHRDTWNDNGPLKVGDR